MDWTFAFYGPVPPHVVRRIHHMAESGVWQWWVQLLGGSIMDSVKETFEVQAANMNGSIVVVFVLWICGMLEATCCFFLEFVWR